MTPEIAVNLYSAREAMAQDLEGTLAAISRIGYRNVELAGYHGCDPERFKRILDANNLRAVSAHVPIDRFENELEVVIGEARLLGLDALVVPWLSPEQRTVDFIKDLFAKLNAWGEKVVENRMRLAYHNHDFEYSIMLRDRSMMEILLADTHADFVDLEPDLYWIAEAGFDPVHQLLEMHPRVRMIHAKDRAADGSIANVGSGVLDWDGIFRAAERVMANYLIVEHDFPTDLVADLTASYQFLSGRLATT
ncbi:MAG TPA: sugar phosphate isomerase/epimerase [Thermomicrobiales bacterium]|nr:sugar phosphate isomerase/epimerase [Thermomicrobiales bacterium]